MRLEPLRDWMSGFALIHNRQDSKIILPDRTTKVTRCYLLEEVGPLAADAGFAPGQIVIAKSVHDMLFHGGSWHRVTFEVGMVIHRVRDVQLDEFTLLDNTPVTAVLGVQAPHLIGAHRKWLEAA